MNLTNAATSSPAAGLGGLNEEITVAVSSELVELSKDKSVIIDADAPENIKVLEPGSYELNVNSLFKGDPVILRTDSEVYYVKLPTPKGKKKLR